jgi:hypothetical protein
MGAQKPASAISTIVQPNLIIPSDIQARIDAGELYRIGLFRSGTDLESFYRQQGFTILPKGQPLDLFVVFGIGGGIFPDRGERMFYHHPQSD